MTSRAARNWLFSSPPWPGSEPPAPSPRAPHRALPPVFPPSPSTPLLEAIFLLFLVVIGFHALDWIATRGRQSADVLPLPRRATRWAEWGTGAAIGWGLALAAVLPLLVSLNLHAHLAFRRNSVPGILLALVTLLVIALAEEAIFRGYPFRRLMAAVGPTWSTILISAGFAVFLLTTNAPTHLFFALLDGTLFGILLALAYLRTHALWLGWGLHFAYRAIVAVVFGLPIAGRSDFISIADTYTTGPTWLSGGFFGVDAAFLTAVVLALGIAVLYRTTGEFAWAYTRREIVPAGYEVVIAPPAAHTAMEKTAAPPPLVQILSTTPQTFAAPPQPPAE